MKKIKEINIRRPGRPRKSAWVKVKKSKWDRKPRPCACGCGGQTKGGFFLLGHSARLFRAWGAHVKFGKPLTPLSEAMFEEYKLNPNRSPIQVAADYWEKQDG